MLAGLALGAASTLKFTAWPLVVLALWAATDRQRRRAVGATSSPWLVLVVPVVLPVALHNPSAFIDNVVRFPLGPGRRGLAGGQRAARAILVSALPGDPPPLRDGGRLVGLAVLVRHLIASPPRDAAAVARLTGWVMLVAILLAPATRVGYLLYPINLFLWAWMFRRSDDPAADERRIPSRRRSGRGSVAVGVSSTSIEYGVVPGRCGGGDRRRRPPSRSRRHCPAWPAPRWCRRCPAGRARRR